MGLFDFFKKKSPPPFEASLVERDGPSPHYILAHLALRSIALNDSIGFLAITVSEKFEAFLEDLLNDIDKEVAQKRTFSAKDVKVHASQVNGFPCAVLVLPEPQEPAEAHMVALVVPISQESDLSPQGETPQGRYFTLELGVSLSGDQQHTVLCEWDESSHLNYGEGPPVNVEDFLKAISLHF